MDDPWRPSVHPIIGSMDGHGAGHVRMFGACMVMLSGDTGSPVRAFRSERGRGRISFETPIETESQLGVDLGTFPDPAGCSGCSDSLCSSGCLFD